MCQRLGILLVWMGLSVTVQAQQDSVVLATITVYGIPDAKYLSGSHIQHVDSALADVYQSNHVGELLSFQFPIYFRNYGSGMLSGISMRGTSPQHTAVLWNGININSFSLGQADFSILPAVAFDEVKVHTGGGSSRFGSGAFGGSVLLNTHAAQASSLTVRQEAGSFGNYFTSVKGSFQRNNFSTATSLYRHQAQNNFRIHKTGARQHHADYMHNGLVQNFAYTISSHQSLQLNYWFHSSDRNIQPTTGNPLGQDEQQDENHRLVVSYQQNNGFGLLKGGAGFVRDEIVFNRNESAIVRWIAFVNHQYTLPHNWHIQTSIDWNHIIGKIKEYGSQPVEDRIDASLAVQKSFNRLSISVNLRKPVITDMKTLLVPYIGADVALVKTTQQRLTLSVNASGNFRAPTLNDRYWQNAGKKDLLPEKSKATEVGLVWITKNFSTRTTGFYQLIDQWILWSPDNTNTYRPDNIKKVEIKGVETSAHLNWNAGFFKQQLTTTYQYTRSITKEANIQEAASIGKQLIYTPIHTATLSITSQVKDWTIGIFNQYASQRFTVASNAAMYTLDPYVLTDVSFGRLFRYNNHVFQARFLVRNVLDIEYLQYAARAMPGRSFTLSITCQLNHKSNTHEN